MAQDKVSITLEIEKIGKGLEEVKKGITDLTNQVKGEGAKIQAETSRIDTGFKGISRSIRGIKALLPTGLAAFIGIAGIYKIVTGIFETGTAFETLRFQLRAVSTTIKEADADFEAIRQFAAKTPFMTQNVTQAFIMLKAVGLAPTRREMEIFGNTAFAMGRDITDVAQSIIALETEVLRRLGIQLDRTGKKAVIMSGDMRVEVENSVNAIRDAVIDVWEKRFPGAMKEAEKSWKGLAALLASEWDELKALLAESVLPTMKDLVKWMIEATKATRGYFASLKEGTVENLNQKLEVAKQRVMELQEAMRAGAQTQDEAIMVAEGYGWMLDDNKTRQEKLNKELHEAENQVLMLSAQIVALTEEEKANIDAKKRLTDATKKLREEAEKWGADVRLKAAVAEQQALDAWLGELDPLIAKHGELKEAIDEVAKAAEWAAETRLKAAIAEQEALDDWLEDLDQLKAKHGELTNEAKKTATGMASVWEDFQSTFQWSLEAGFADLFKGEMDGIGDYFKQFCDGLINAFARAVAKMIADWISFENVASQGGKGWGWLSSLLSGIFGALGGGAGYNMEWGGMYQHGGWINEPTLGFGKSGRVSLFGEAGPELLTPGYAVSGARERDLNIYLVDDRAKAPMPSKDDIVLVVSEDIQRGGSIRKTIKRFT